MRALVAPLLAFFCVVASAQTPQPPEIAARSYLLVDVTANQILASREIDAPVEPSSLTKLMSAYIVFDALRAKKIDLKQTLPVSERAWKMPGSRMFIDPSMQVPVEDLIKGMIVQSGNDATMALAEGVGGTAEHFVELMNQQAKAMGLKATSFKNPEGLTVAGHTTTARDLSVIATRLMQDFPDYVGYYQIKKYRYEGTPTANDTNRNMLLFRDPTVDGLKTGHTDAAGYCIIATARRDFPNVGSRRLLAVVLGAASDIARANEAQKLLNWGYTAYEGIKLFDANQAVVTPEVWKGAQKTAKLGRSQPVVVAVPAGTAARVKTQVARPDPLVAPLAKGQQVGTLKVMAGEQQLLELPLQALEGVEQAGIFSRAWDAVRLWIK
jgi:D-alanyl-D-alanine carboxypeptidase (penicillin-binding protein 5/6)